MAANHAMAGKYGLLRQSCHHIVVFDHSHDGQAMQAEQ